MAIRTELHVRLPNSPGALAEACRVLGDGRVNVLALSLETSGHLRLVVDNPLHAAALLREHHHTVDQREIIYTTVPNSPGALATVLRMVADAHVNAGYAYSGAGEAGMTVGVAIGVEDAERAAAAAGL